MSGLITLRKRKLQASLVLSCVLLLPYSESYAEVKEKPISSIEIIQNPNRVIYDIGEDVDLYGMKVKVTFVDGEEYTADYKDLICVGYQPEQTGSQLVLVQYGGATTPFAVTVQKGTIRKLEARAIQRDVWIGGTVLKPEYFEVTAVLDNGRKEVVSDFEFYPNLLQNGRNIITIHRGSISTTVTIEGRENICQSIRIESPGTSEFDVGETFNWRGLRVIAHYLDGTEDDVTSACRVTGVNTGKTGSYYAEVSYQEKKVTYPVKVVDLTVKNIDLSQYYETEQALIYFNEREEPSLLDGANIRYEDNYETNVRTFYLVYKNKTFTKEEEIPEADRKMVGSNRIVVQVPIGITLTANEEGRTGYVPETILQSKGESGITMRTSLIGELGILHGLPASIYVPAGGVTPLALDIESGEFYDGKLETFFAFNTTLEVKQ